jgi:hypothetical protein
LVPDALPTVRCLRRDLGVVSARTEERWWAGLPALGLKRTVTGDTPAQGTTVKLAWDETELRVLFAVEDTHVSATLTERDAPLYQEEVVEIFLDPVGDLESYFEIELNPLNAVLDLVLRRNRSGYVKDFAWRCEGLRTAVCRTARGWCGELAIPFASLIAAAPNAGARWRVNFCRIDRPPGVERELSAWSPTGRANFHTPERFGFLEFAR